MIILKKIILLRAQRLVKGLLTVEKSVGVYFGRSTASSSLHSLRSAMVKRIHSGAGTSSIKRRKTGIDSNWSADLPWMLAVDDGQGMMCSLCRKHSRRPLKAAIGRAIWVDLACKSLFKQSLVKHSKSESHISAVQMEADLCVLQDRWWNNNGIATSYFSSA